MVTVESSEPATLGSPSVINPATSFRWPVLFVAIVAGGHLPLFGLHLFNLYRFRPHYEFAPLILAAIAFLLWQRWPRSNIQHSKWTRRVGDGLIGAGVFVLAAAVVVYSPLLATVAAGVTSAGLLLRFAGTAAWYQLLPVWMLFWIIVPPPFSLDMTLIRELQGYTTRGCSLLLDVCQVYHVPVGNVVRLPGRELFVAEACSGVHSQLVLLACGAMLAVFQRRPLLFAALLLVSSSFWAITANLGRVFLVAWLMARWGVDATQGWRHELLGYALVLVGFVLLVSTDQLLYGCLAPIRVKGSRPNNPLSRFWNYLFGNQIDTGSATRTSVRSPPQDRSSQTRRAPSLGWLSATFAGLCFVLGLIQLAALAVAVLPASSGLTSGLMNELESTVANLSLPDEVGDWKLVSEDVEEREELAIVGRHSRVWLYQRRGETTRVAVDFPFDGWHELTICYEAIGWEIVSRHVLEESGCVEVVLRKKTGELGYLWFTLCDFKGRSAAPHRRIGLLAKLQRSPVIALAGLTPRDDVLTTQTLQIQQFLLSPVPKSPSEVEQLRADFQRRHDALVGDLPRVETP